MKASIESKNVIKYLGLILDDRLDSKDHAKFVGQKAFVIQGALMRMIPNIGRSNPFKRRIIRRVVASIMLYDCPMWPESLSVSTIKQKLSCIA